MKRANRSFGRIVVLGAALLVAARGAAAHDIPADVVVQAWVKPQGRVLHVLVRVPLGAMRDVEFPMAGPDYLDLGRADAALREAAILWIANGLEVLEDQRPLPIPHVIAARVALPSDRSFETYESAYARVTGPPLPPDTQLVWNQAMLHALLEYPIQSDRGAFGVRPSFGRLGLQVRTALRYIAPNGTVRAFEYSGDPGLIRLDPRWHQAAGRFVALGFEHILSGTDHLLFLLCLVVPFRRLRPLVVIVTSFTVAHSIALVASAADLVPDGLWFAPLVEMLIAASIVYMALENIVGPGTVRRRWIAAFGFGLVHGLGFSFALRESLQFAGAHLVASLLAFNVGVELGQLAVLGVLVPALGAVFAVTARERIATILLSAIVAHTAWHWMVDRADRVMQFPWPRPDVALLLGLARWLPGVALLVAAAWLAVSARRRSVARSAL